MLLTISDQSSTVLHLLFHINVRYTIFWFLFEIICFIFKLYQLPYASNAFGLEMALIFMVCFNDLFRLFFGIKGNLTLKFPLLVLSIVYGIFSIVGFVFFLVLQSYSQRVEILLAGISLLLILIEIIFTIVTIILDARYHPVLTKDEKVNRVRLARQRIQETIQNE